MRCSSVKTCSSWNLIQRVCMCADLWEFPIFTRNKRSCVQWSVSFLNHAYNFVIIICVIIYVGINLVNWLIRWKNFDCLYWWCFRGHKWLMFSIIVYHFALLIFPILIPHSVESLKCYDVCFLWGFLFNPFCLKKHLKYLKL